MSKELGNWGDAVLVLTVCVLIAWGIAWGTSLVLDTAICGERGSLTFGEGTFHCEEVRP